MWNMAKIRMQMMVLIQKSLARGRGDLTTERNAQRRLPRERRRSERSERLSWKNVGMHEKRLRLLLMLTMLK
jgi:hypothetical protein